MGSVVSPSSAFSLVAQDESTLRGLIAKTGKSATKPNIKGAFVYDATNGKQFAQCKP
ncbi:hypothetical protein [Pedobacter westerhofensis]|uniref:hypothetical protein n=1 Tax=Pedobacter westerhofensis TaxID=425512 RepID=UPI00163D614B|nr:hypothetical protein [Pedobacter westerhofensis]